MTVITTVVTTIVTTIVMENRMPMHVIFILMLGTVFKKKSSIMDGDDAKVRTALPSSKKQRRSLR